MSVAAFPFDTSDLKYWVVKRKDGLTIKHVLKSTGGAPTTKALTAPTQTQSTGYSTYSPHLSDWCHHDPENPIWFSEEPSKTHPSEKAVELYVGDLSGARKLRTNFDFIIDGGNVITAASMNGPLLEGDEELAAELKDYAENTTGPRVLKIDWEDRKAPLLHPEFWTALMSKISGRILVCCQGGHGRSGSSAVCLMMVLVPSYSARDAIVHLRALHCPRAIESNVQHDYLNRVAEYLGRPQNAKTVEEIKDYRAEFRKLAETNQDAARFLKILEAKGAKK